MNVPTELNEYTPILGIFTGELVQSRELPKNGQRIILFR
jgi:hypothetical protein